MNIFSQNLENLRIEKGLLAKDIAEALTVSAATVSGWLSGNKKPKFENIEAIAGFFIVPVYSLFVDYNSQGKAVDVTGLPEEDIALVSSIVKRLKEDYKKDG